MGFRDWFYVPLRDQSNCDGKMEQIDLSSVSDIAASKFSVSSVRWMRFASLPVRQSASPEVRKHVFRIYFSKLRKHYNAGPNNVRWSTETRPTQLEKSNTFCHSKQEHSIST